MHHPCRGAKPFDRHGDAHAIRRLGKKCFVAKVENHARFVGKLQRMRIELIHDLFPDSCFPDHDSGMTIE